MDNDGADGDDAVKAAPTSSSSSSTSSAAASNLPVAEVMDPLPRLDPTCVPAVTAASPDLLAFFSTAGGGRRNSLREETF